MGWAKEQQQREYERGVAFIGRKYVCERHFEDQDIQNFIRQHAAQPCTYCAELDEEEAVEIPEAARIDDVMDFILEALRTEFGQADVDEVVARDPEDDHQIWGTATFDGIEVLTDGADLIISEDGVYNDIEQAMAEGEWVLTDPYGPRPHQYRSESWRRFMKATRHEAQTGEPEQITQDSWDAAIYAPERMLDIVMESLQELEDTPLFRTLPAGTQLFRVRTSAEKVTDAAGLGPPPPDKAGSQRLSRRGQVAMYTALSAATAKAEARGWPGDTVMNVAQFVLQQPLLVLDFTALPSRPGLFDPQKRSLRHTIPFLEEFTKDITEPVENRDESDGWIYEPTQRLADALRVYRTMQGEAVMGVIYPSSRGTEVNAVFFVDASLVGQMGDDRMIAFDAGALDHVLLS